MIYLRNQSVDISRYLPQFLKRDRVMKDLLDTHSWEHEHLRLNVDDISNQFFVHTATWGLADWERLLELTTTSADTYEDRRKRIFTRLQTKQTSTLEFMTQLINRYILDKSGKIVEHPESYTIDIICPLGEITDYKDLNKAIGIYIPAHIGYKMSINIPATLKMFAVTSEYEREVLSEEIKTLADGKENVYVGIGSALTKRTEIRGAEFDTHIKAGIHPFVTGGILDREVIRIA